MWSRSELKQTAKIRFKTNYWKSVLAALILFFVIGGGTGSRIDHVFNDNSEKRTEYSMTELRDEVENANAYRSYWDWEENGTHGIYFAAVAIGIVIVVLLFVCIIVIPLKILVFNPLEVGCKRFFGRNLKGDAQVKEICYAFDNSYKNNIKTMFFRGLYTFLWTLLLIIPGIIKSYEYQMIPYILAENTHVTMEEAFALSKKMMYGNKWKSFVLDLSFIGWNILNAITFGILGILYVNPYKAQTEAALYDAIKNN